MNEQQIKSTPISTTREPIVILKTGVGGVKLDKPHTPTSAVGGQMDDSTKTKKPVVKSNPTQEIDDFTLARMYLSKADSCVGRKLEFSLPFKEYRRLIATKRCAYTGERFPPWVDNRKVAPWNARTLERIDSSKGYVTGNVIAVCLMANQFKATLENKKTPLDIKMARKILSNIEKHTNIVGAEY